MLSIIVCLVFSAQALQQQSLSADPAGFRLAQEKRVNLDEEFPRFQLLSEEAASEEFGMKAEELMARMSVNSELTPLDFKEKSRRSVSMTMFQSVTHQVTYFGAVALFGAGIAAIYSSRGILQSVAVCAYVISLTLMSVSIRNVYVNFSFNYPQWLVVMHSLSTAIVGGAILKYRQSTGGKSMEIPTVTTIAKGLLPVAMAFALSLGLSNLGLLYSNAHFYEMMTTFQVFAVVGLGMMLGKPFNPRFSMPMIVCTVGLFAVAIGEFKFNTLGAAFVLGGVIVRAAKVQLQSMLLAPNQMTQHFDAVELTFWTAVITFLIMLCWSFAAEGVQPWTDINDMSTIMAVAMTCGAAIILNFCSLFVMQDVGPVAQQLIGQMKGVLACVGGWAAFQETITMQQVAGYALAISGIIWYNHIDLQIKHEARADMQKILQAERAQS